MNMHNPPHPGEILQGLWLEPMSVTVTIAAEALGISRQSLSKIVNGSRGVTPEMAVRISRAFGGSPESWLGHQAAFDLWRIQQNREVPDLKRLEAA
ncbi:MAG TPA: HigA family addiction module antitoxin [Candidatus Competibacteraceae bacterium]|nr:HigA family addiction module antitoxin [Candidatus Competibacteraceae bacterium]